MKRFSVSLFVLAAGFLFLVSSCTTVNLTSWKDPAVTAPVKSVFVLTLFEKLDVSKPFEEYTASTFATGGLTTFKSLDYMAPNQGLSADELESKVKSLGADVVLVYAPKGKDNTVNYTPPTYSGFYGGYRGGIYSVSPGYYSESTTYHIQANLYSVQDGKLIWTGDLSSTDPTSAESAAYEVAKSIYNDWVKNNLVVKPAK
jgi:hypothetical protein